jgi:hypothetical protein
MEMIVVVLICLVEKINFSQKFQAGWSSQEISHIILLMLPLYKSHFFGSLFFSMRCLWSSFKQY